jgi:hypothetical protein
MRKLLLLFLLLIWVATNIIAQTALEIGMAENGIEVNLPSLVDVTQNAELFYVTPVCEKSPVPEIAQQFGAKASFGDTFFKVFFGTINSILTYKNGECIVFVYTFPGHEGSAYGRIIQDSTKLFTFRNITFERIKHDFKYGLPNNSPSELDADELYSMLTHYTYKKAKKMFNANAMISYPLNLRGNIYKEKYTPGRAVVAGKEHRQFYLYFMMTDESVLNFDKYLHDFKKAFWFKE